MLNAINLFDLAFEGTIKYSNCKFEVKIKTDPPDGQTDRQTNSLTPYEGIHIFLSVKFATSLLPSLARGIIYKGLT